jgi:hypothetical protein
VPLPTDLALLKSRFLHRINGSDNGPAEQARRQKPRQPDVRRGFRISGKETQGESEESRILAQACRYYDITNPAIVLPLELEAVLLGDAIPGAVAAKVFAANRRHVTGSSLRYGRAWLLRYLHLHSCIARSIVARSRHKSRKNLEGSNHQRCLSNPSSLVPIPRRFRKELA